MSTARAGILSSVHAADRAYQQSVTEMNDAVMAYLGINRSDARCLTELNERGTMTAGELAASTDMSTGALTALLDRLESDGYIRRIRDTDDGRRVLAALTDDARQVFSGLFGPVRQAPPWFDHLSAGDLNLIRDFLLYRMAGNQDNARRIRAMPSRSKGRRPGRKPAPRQ